MSLKKKIDFGNFENFYDLTKLATKNNLFYRKKNDLIREFEKEKWSKALELIRKKKVELNEIENIFLNLNNKILCYEAKSSNKLRVLKYKTALDIQFNYLKSKILEHKNLSNNIVELGAGFGSKILRLAKLKVLKEYNFFASDIANNGVKFMKIYSSQNKINLNVGTCNFLENIFYDKKIPKNSIIYSFFSFCYLKKMDKTFIKKLLELKPAIIINFEPCFYSNSFNNTHKILKQRYLEFNKYNINYKDTLKLFESKNIIDLKYTDDVFGINPLLPFTIFEWKEK